jgi:hypothetical protein
VGKRHGSLDVKGLVFPLTKSSTSRRNYPIILGVATADALLLSH